jgi:hypothetical protein
MENPFGFQRRKPKEESCNVTAQKKRQRRIVGCAGVACPDATPAKWFISPRKTARGATASVLARNRKLKRVAIQIRVGAALTQPPA